MLIYSVIIKINNTERKKQEYIFTSIRSGEHIKSIREYFESALTVAGIHEFWFHTLKGSHYVVNGDDQLSLRDKLGYSNLKMAERYSQIVSANKQIIINKLDGKYSDCHLYVTSEDQPQNRTKEKPRNMLLLRGLGW